MSFQNNTYHHLVHFKMIAITLEINHFEKVTLNDDKRIHHITTSCLQIKKLHNIK